MHALAFYMVAARRQDLLAEAEQERLGRLVRSSDGRVSPWRRGLGRGARGLSAAFASAARALDPAVERRKTRRVSA
jgi:hypothetical protein